MTKKSPKTTRKYSDAANVFFETLTPEILDPADFVDWDGIRKEMHPIRREIALLKSVDLSNPTVDLGDLICKNPAMLNVLQRYRLLAADCQGL